MAQDMYCADVVRLSYSRQGESSVDDLPDPRRVYREDSLFGR